MEQRKNTRPDIDRTDVVFAENAVSYFSAKESNNSSIKQQLREHLDEVNAISPVAEIQYSPTNKKNLRAQAVQEFKKIGYKVERQGFGIIEIDDKQIEKSLKYITTDGERAALLAVPKVLKRGIEISGHKDHKGRSYGTITIAAPISINGKIGDVAVVVKVTGKNRYSTHRILMPDGSEFVFEENKNTEPTFSDMLAQKNDQGTDISSVSDITVPQKAQAVNSQYMQEGENYTEPNTDGSGVKYSISEKSRNSTISFDIYTEEQYNNFGWVRTNDVLSGTAFNLLIEKIAEIKTGAKFAKSRYGEYIIPVGNESGIYNILVYTDGNMESPNIRKVIEINTENDFLLSSIRSDIYDAEERKLYDAYWYVSKIYGTEDITQYKRNDCKSFRQYARERKRGTGEEGHRPGRIGQEGRRAPESAGAVNQYSTDDRADLNEESAFSLPESENKVPYSIPSRTAADLLDQYERGEITKEEYLARITKQRISPWDLFLLSGISVQVFSLVTHDIKNNGYDSEYYIKKITCIIRLYDV